MDLPDRELLERKCSDLLKKKKTSKVGTWQMRKRVVLSKGWIYRDF